jgi:hypothetical protein
VTMTLYYPYQSYSMLQKVITNVIEATEGVK